MENYDKNNYILNLIQYINSNFENSSDLKINIKNIRTLINFIKDNKDNLEDISDIETLAINCPLLIKTIRVIKNNKELNSIFSESENEIFKELYNNLVDFITESDKNDKEEYEDTLNDDITYDTFCRKNTTVSKDIFNFYMKEISKIPLLTPEEEKSLAYEVRKGNDEAKARFAAANLRLVVNIAKYYTGKGLDILDLIQEGNIGLLTAVEKYDPDRGTKFSTYATYWIRQAVIRAISRYARSIRISYDAVYQLKRIDNVQRNYMSEYQREATEEELAEILGLSLSRIKELKNLPEDSISLDTPVGEDKDNTLVDFVTSEENFEEEVIKKLSNEEFMELFNSINLPQKDKEIVLLRAGYYDGNPKTLEEIGQIYGITRERIRQIEARALRRLRKNDQVKEFSDNDRIALQNYYIKSRMKKLNNLTEYIEGTKNNLKMVKKNK